VGANDFQVVSEDLKAVSGASATNVQGERGQYLVTVNTGTGDGTLRLDLIDNDSILDLANNPSAGRAVGMAVLPRARVLKLTRPRRC
jgi:hypothetical protein